MSRAERRSLGRTATQFLSTLKVPADSTMTMIFIALTVSAALFALVLGVRAARHQLPVAFGEEQVKRNGTEVTVQVRVKNRTERLLCPEIRFAARDREGLDLDEVVARPEDGSRAVEPQRSKLYGGTFRGLSERVLTEELDEFTAYLVPDSEECSAGGEGAHAWVTVPQPDRVGAGGVVKS